MCCATSPCNSYHSRVSGIHRGHDKYGRLDSARESFLCTHLLYSCAVTDQCGSALHHRHHGIHYHIADVENCSWHSALCHGYRHHQIQQLDYDEQLRM